jgi:hypothetical protein
MAQRCLDRIDQDRRLRDAPDLQPLRHPVIQQQRAINGRQPVLDSTDALLDAVRDMTLQVAALRAMVADIQEGIQEQRHKEANRQADLAELNKWLFPSNALRHSR